MSSALLFDSISRIARHEASARPTACAGVVTSIFPNSGAGGDYAVTVRLRESGIVLPRVPVATGVMGFAAIPAVDDLVVVAFLEGDFNSPIVLGRLYHPDEDPPKHADGAIVLRLPSGASEPDLNCEISSDPVRLLLTLPDDVKIQVEKDAIDLAVGEISVKIEAAGGGRLTAAAGGSSLTIKKDGDITLSSQTNLKLEAASNLEITGQAKVKITGAVVEIN